MHGQSEVNLRIAYDLRFTNLTGGGAVYTSQLLQFLIKNHLSARWLIFYNPDSQSQQKIIYHLCNLPHKPRINPQPVRSPILALRQHLEFLRQRPDANLYHYPHFDAPLGLRHIPLVLTIYDLYPLTIKGYCSPAKRAYFKHLTAANVKRAAAVITISEHSKNDLIEQLGVPEKKIVVTPLGFSDDFHPIDNPEYLQSIRQKYQLPDEFIFYCGNQKPHKNLPRLLRAYARLPQPLRRNFPLRLTGSPDNNDGLLSLAQDLGLNQDLAFIGWIDQDDLPALYNLASLLVLPSLYEGFGLTPLEALACGTPVACSHAAAIPEVVGSVGRLFDPYSLDDITATISAALQQDINCPNTRRACLDRAAQFSWNKTARQTFQLYQTIAQQQNA
jgi:glycosyltransferase involved in cell wall biosynthesis